MSLLTHFGEGISTTLPRRAVGPERRDLWFRGPFVENVFRQGLPGSPTPPALTSAMYVVLFKMDRMQLTEAATPKRKPGVA
jgi:hypothetical protein